MWAQAGLDAVAGGVVGIVYYLWCFFAAMLFAILGGIAFVVVVRRWNIWREERSPNSDRD